MSTEDKTEVMPFEERVLFELSTINSRLDNMNSRMDDMNSRMTLLETKSEERSRETRPMWEQALKEIMDTKHRLDDIDSKLEIVVVDITSSRGKIRQIEKRLNDL